jgi:endo-1,4-beta-xylanase
MVSLPPSFRPQPRRGSCLALVVGWAGWVLACGSEGGPRGVGALGTPSGPAVAAMPDLSCDAAAIDAGQVSLAEVYAPFFKLGVAVGGRMSAGDDPAAAALAARQYNRATPENALKWQSVHPDPERFDWGPADAFLDFAEDNGMEVHGHALVWHQQVPDWVFRAPAGGAATRELLLERLDAHMAALSEHFAGRIRYWDVVNEAFNDDGSKRETPWLEGIGLDYIEQAFILADRHFPDAKLVYNDFGMENAGKREAVVEMARDFRARGVRLDAIGTQGHVRLDVPLITAIEESIEAFGQTGAEVLVSELDVDVLPPASQNQGADLSVNAEPSARLNPYAECLPATVAAQAAERWSSLFELFIRHSSVVRAVTIWGVSDGHSWLNDWPVNGRTNYASLFDRELKPKAAWQSVIDAASSAP